MKNTKTQDTRFTKTNLWQKIRRNSLLIILLSIAFSPVQAAVWKNTAEWSEAEEKKFSQWVNKHWTVDFFMREDNPDYFKLQHDCGDVPYYMRIIYAYENGLPFAMNHPTKKGKIISNETNRFNKIPAGTKRIRAFLKYISNIVGTTTLANDTYPIALKALRPGDIYLSPGNHTYQITAISETGVPTLLSSTTPRSTRHLARHTSFPMYVPSDKEKMSDGYRRFRQPEKLQTSMEKLPEYSDEQYQLGKEAEYNYLKFSNKLAKILGTRPETPKETGQRMIDDLCTLVTDRDEYVKRGVEYLQKVRNTTRRECLNQAEFDQYSTYSRDTRMIASFHQTRRMMQQMMMTGGDPQVIEIMQAIFSPEAPSKTMITTLEARCLIRPEGPDSQLTLNLHDLWQLMRNGSTEPNPHATLKQRWGLSKQPYDVEKAKCPSFE